jgi:hypothetical protein
MDEKGEPFLILLLADCLNLQTINTSDVSDTGAFNNFYVKLL